jgi:signal transduction histidine kinase
MLEFTRVSRSERRPVRLQEIVSETVLLFRQSAAPPPVTVEMPAPPIILELDPVLVRHALFNLLVNAAEAAPPDAPIVVRLMGERQNGRDGWTIAVLDRGPGVPDDAKERIFVPFFSTRADGTGLGLPVARHIALLHDGRISVADRPDGGARFAIWLPCPDDTAPAQRNPSRGGPMP